MKKTMRFFASSLVFFNMATLTKHCILQYESYFFIFRVFVFFSKKTSKKHSKIQVALIPSKKTKKWFRGMRFGSQNGSPGTTFGWFLREKRGLDFGTRFSTFFLEKTQKREKWKSSFRIVKYSVSWGSPCWKKQATMRKNDFLKQFSRFWVPPALIRHHFGIQNASPGTTF